MRLISCGLPLATVLLIGIFLAIPLQAQTPAKTQTPPAQKQPAPRPQGFDGQFAFLRTRNIFDPDRQPLLTPPPAPVLSHADYAALTGIMITPSKTVAFFSGSRSEYNTVQAQGGNIAGARIQKITPNTIDIERTGKTVTVAVGQTVPLDANARPMPAPTPVNLAAFNAASSTSFASSSGGIPSLLATPDITHPPGSTPPASTGAADRDSILKRMIEKRQQELQPR